MAIPITPGPGHGVVLATQETLDLMRLRYGEKLRRRDPGDRLWRDRALDGARVSFHPAGHVLGAAQIAVAANGMRIVASGDYKDVPGSDLRAVRARLL